MILLHLKNLCRVKYNKVTLTRKDIKINNLHSEIRKTGKKNVTL